MRDLHGDGADVVAVLRAIINACEHDERACRWDPERQRQQQANRGERPEPRQDPDQHSDNAASSAEQKILHSQRVTEAKYEIVDEFHVRCSQ